MPSQYSGKLIARVVLAHILGASNEVYHPLNPEFERRYGTAFQSDPLKQAIGKSRTGFFQASSWNVNLSSGIDDVIRAITTTEDMVNSDVIAIQEIRTKDKSAENSLEKIKEATGFGYYCCIEMVEINGNSIEGDLGIAILSRHRVIDSGILNLEQEKYSITNRGKHYLGRGTAVRAKIAKDGRDVVAYSAHLKLVDDLNGRRSQMIRLLEDSEKYRANPVIIGGDFNFIYESQRGETLKGVRQHGFEDPFGDNGQPTLNDTFWRIAGPLILGGNGVLDRIMPRGLKTVHTKVHYDVGVSDHHPITAVYNF